MASLTAARSGIKLNRNADRKVKPPQRIEAGDMDYTFLFIVILLLFFGLVMLLSASAPSGNTIYGDSYYFFKKQVIGAAIGLIGMFVISKVNYNVYKAFAKPMMIICTILLVFVLIPGIGVKLNGSRRWLNTPFLQLQPSEFMKPVIAMYFAKLIDNGKYDLKKLGGNLPYIGWLIVVLGLMLMETHLSGAIVIAGIGITVMIAGGTPIKPILIGLLVIIPVGIIAVHAISAVRWARVTSFLDPFRDIRNQSYQVAQGLYAIGSGGFFGLGLGQSVQKYSYLPEPYNDFIFAIVCEELGLVGAIVVILLFAALIMRAIKIAMNAPDTYSSIVALGISAHLAIQTVLNIAVATSSVPNTGVSLPFFSYGGTAILTLLMEMGVLLNISRYSIKE
ncbi:MAG: putative lipid II flippase FtsW [Clostridia bacterium]|nr:putative lipid II flippase FtsW [Clostridia bacterium]MBQ9600272.1 putative lipid II flippase FtsW [Clostridia bacterium]MBR0028329.1 putative lipid II flippase FtsW [Clostridia bacterium]MBR0470134.1 putative lipid II flippase FtsW [Clostridia bacterium]